jgi:23S rRNA (guanosine2251-2'-O)-methyltransferase
MDTYTGMAFRFYGINPVTEALRSSQIPLSITVASGKTNPGLQKIRALAREQGVPVREARNLDRLAGNPGHQGVLAEIADDGVRGIPREGVDSDRVVIFDGIQDPHNFGAALRVCECFGWTTVIFHKGNSCGVTPTAIKVSAGAFFHMDLYASNLNSAVRRLQESGYAIWALEGDGDAELGVIEPPQKLALVIGSEGKGVRFAIKRLADTIVRIPLAGHVNSLNVSCALASALTTLRLQSP